jgi:hypothetical protein
MPKNARRAKTRAQTNNTEKRSLDRFGCALRARTGTICIDWRGLNITKAVNAGIFTALVYYKTESGPLVLLACEVSPERPLPRYFYLPLDLTNEVHRKYISRFVELGEIKFRFVADKQTFERIHRLSADVRRRTSEVYEAALRDWETHEKKRYDFDGTLRFLERHIRMPMLLDRILQKDNLSEITQKTEDAMKLVPVENADLACRIAGDAARALVPYYRANGETLFEKFNAARLGLTCLIDLRRSFEGDPEGLKQFVVRGLAVTFSRQELESIDGFLKIVISLFGLPFKDTSPSPSEVTPKVPQLPPELVHLFQSMTSSIPKDAPVKLFELIGLPVGGKPGRPRRDYSREYELRVSGSKWSEITRQVLAETPVLQAEFGAADYNLLSYEARERLQNRIRQGVRTYAERTGKAIPSEVETPNSVSPKPEGG